jgi:pyrimidine-nucleoside phosphorylase
MLTASLIHRKRQGEPLPPGEWRALIAEFAAGRVPDYQMSAMLMAVVFQGMVPEELDALTDAMLASGETLAFGADVPPRVDKHSTGGVGDKVSLVLAPLVASCELAVPMIAGRGLGHTGGTLDKLESIPGFRTGLSREEAQRQVERIGCVIMGQTPDIVPADRRLYALRDATATVACLPLIAASIMSKKLAEDLQGLVLDVKTGSGAFLPDRESALALARTMVRLGAARGCPTTALLTAMDRPLGHACGNALEAEEALLALKGEAPPDLLEVTLALGVEMLLAGGVDADRDAARTRLQAALDSGRAAERFAAMIEAQGGNPAVLDDPAVLPQALVQRAWTAPTSGIVQQVAPRPIGAAIVEMGGGRHTMDDTVDPAVGFVVTAKPGDSVERGQPLATAYARDEAGLAVGMRALDEAIAVGHQVPERVLQLVEGLGEKVKSEK